MTFRDSNGLWANYDINVVCNYHSWRQNYELVHKFYNLRREELARVHPKYCAYNHAKIIATI